MTEVKNTQRPAVGQVKKAVKKTVVGKKAPASSVSKKVISKEVSLKTTVKKTATKKDNVFSIIETGGKQYLIRKGDVVTVEKIKGEHKKGDTIIFDKVLLAVNEKEVKIGMPYLKGVKVEGTLEDIGKGKKITVIKFKRKIRYSRKYGHRQPYMKVKIR